jgi:hypothetical protein
MKALGIGLRRTAIVIASAVAVTATLLAASPASATTYVPSGRPGTSGVHKTYGTHNYTWLQIGSGGVTAYRSPASSGTQKVTIRWRVWRTYGGTWQLADDVSTTYTVYPGQYVNYPGWIHESAFYNYYSTDLRITWRTSTGTFLGDAYRDFIHRDDYECLVWSGCAVVWAGNPAQYSLLMN